MGFMEKVKNLFTEEEEIVEPVKKEVIKVEIKAPVEKREEMVAPKMPEEIKPKEEIKPTPVFFDDKDFDGLKKPESKKKVEPPKRPAYHASKIESRKDREKKVFKPSPIISPVYGILDKNYKKEDIMNKDEELVTKFYRSSSARDLSLDEVRQKAFGTLEDDIDFNLNTEEVALEPAHDEINEPDEASLESDIFSEMEATPTEDDFSDHDITLSEGMPSRAERNKEVADNLVNEALNQETTEEVPEEIDESDLFNLIDSMYEKRDEE